MAAIAGPGWEMAFFTWREALTGDYDIFHLHWPEQLLGTGRGPGAWARRLRLRALLRRLRRRKVPVVYTLHNHHPHDRAASASLMHAQRAFAALTRVEIHLVPEPARRTEAAVAPIPHGGYREPFASHPRPPAEPGRILAFGILRRYKGIGRLLEAFSSIDDRRIALRIVGEAADDATVAEIRSATASDSRVTAQFGFVPDAELVAEVSRAQLVVLPYAELHSSGAVLLALSLDRPVLVPASPTTEALREEVGAGWVRVFSAPLTAEAISEAVAEPTPAGAPDLEARAWWRVRDAHREAYLRALG